MSEKEATVYIVDVGKSMGQRRHGREVTDLEWSMQYVWERITGTVRLVMKIYCSEPILMQSTGGYRAQNSHSGCARPQDGW